MSDNQNPALAPAPELSPEARTAAAMSSIRHHELTQAYLNVGFGQVEAEQHAQANADRFRVEIAPDPTDPARLQPIVVDASGRTAGDVLSQEYAFAEHVLHMKRFHAENSFGLQPTRKAPTPPEGSNPLTGRPSPLANNRNVPAHVAAAIAFGKQG